MSNLPVHWFEGMFLRPQHFQAADRFWTESNSASQQWDRHHNYGLHAIDISREALGNYQFQVSMCHARMQDGTLIRLESGQADQRLDLKPILPLSQKRQSILPFQNSRWTGQRDGDGGRSPGPIRRAIACDAGRKSWRRRAGNPISFLKCSTAVIGGRSFRVRNVADCQGQTSQ